MKVTIRPITPVEVGAFVRWRYEPPYDLYNMLPDDGNDDQYEEIVSYFLGSAIHCCAILHEGELAGFCTFGEDARVDGGDYSQPALDIGMGMKPVLTGQNYGGSFVTAVIHYAKKTFAPSPLRVTIHTANRRAQRVWQKVGFVQQERFICPHTDQSFFIFMRYNRV